MSVTGTNLFAALRSMPRSCWKMCNCSLSRTIAFWVFLSLLSIETLLLFPSYFHRERELLVQLEVASSVKANAILSSGEDERLLREKFQAMSGYAMFRGGAFYRTDGRLVARFGELPELTPQQSPNLEPRRVWKGDRYDVVWTSDKYAVAIRHDASSVSRELLFFVLRIAGLVAIISVVVTAATMVVVGVTTIAPILQLSENLTAAGDALSCDRTDAQFYMQSQRQDELGTVMVAFQQMFDRIAVEIAARKQMQAKIMEEKERSEELLLNILPESIAERLKYDSNAIADGFAEVTVLFADIVDFTSISAQISPVALVDLLNRIFSAFDALAEKYELEKIKTIGDAYMVVGGLPEPGENRVAAVADMALEMLEVISGFSSDDGQPFRIRIGINTGPVVAGVIGKKKFIYDLWGDTVNVASRMESNSMPGAILVTRATYDCLQHDFDLVERGCIHVKGKGEMFAYWLKGRKAR